MYNHELGDLLKKRGLFNPQFHSELYRIYGVAYVTPQETEAKKEAIRCLEADDRQKITIPKSIIWAGIVTALIISIVELLKLSVAAWHRIH
jgi:hypothetical protein